MQQKLINIVVLDVFNMKWITLTIGRLISFQK